MLKRAVLTLAALLLAPPLAYLLVALILGLTPANRAFVPTPEERGGVPIFLRTNGLHADLVLPAQGVIDWTREFPRATLLDLKRLPSVNGHNWIAFGWGDRAFYLTTPTWRDLKWRTAWTALSGQGRGAMHVEYLRRPEDYEVVALSISEGEYLALANYVQAHFQRDARGRVHRIAAPGYGATDAFYEGTGSYSPWLTSNDWVRRALAEAGIRTARWSPFDVALLYQARAAMQAPRAD